MQGPRGDGVTPRAAAAARAAARRVVAAPLFDPRLGQVLDAGNPLGNVGDILSCTRHDLPSVRKSPPFFILRLLIPPHGTPVMLNDRTSVGREMFHAVYRARNRPVGSNLTGLHPTTFLAAIASLADHFGTERVEMFDRM